MNPLPPSQDLEHIRRADHGSVDAPISKGRVFWYVVLALFLIVPFVLREVSPQLEPYPAILFPVGAMITNVDDTLLTYSVREVFAVQPDGSEIKISNRIFLGRIEVQNFGPLVSRRFGLEPRRYQTRWSNWFARDKNWTAEERSMTMRWMAWRAQESGYPETRAFRFLRITKTVSSNTREVFNSHVTDSYELVIEHE